MSRVPEINPVTRTRQAQIKQLEQRLADLRRLSAHQRAAEHADEIESDLEAMLIELRSKSGAQRDV